MKTPRLPKGWTWDPSRMTDQHAPVLREDTVKTFNELVTDWLISQKYVGPFENLKVEPYGTDWEGDTETGFRSIFNVTVSWAGGLIEVEGEELASLWRAVVAP